MNDELRIDRCSPRVFDSEAAHAARMGDCFRCAIHVASGDRPRHRTERQGRGRDGLHHVPRNGSARRAEDRRQKSVERARVARSHQPHRTRAQGDPADAGARRQPQSHRSRDRARDRLHGQPVGWPLGRARQREGSDGRTYRQADRHGAVRQVPPERRGRRAQDRRPERLGTANGAGPRQSGSLRDQGAWRHARSRRHGRRDRRGDPKRDQLYVQPHWLRPRASRRRPALRRNRLRRCPRSQGANA